MKRFFVIAFAAALLLSGCACENKYERAQRSTVLIEGDEKFGSGFVVQRRNPEHADKLFIWTAAHVVRGINDVKIHQVILHNGHKVGEKLFAAKVIARDDIIDLALLSMDAPPRYFCPVKFCGSRPIPPVGTPVYHCGNFLGPRFPGSVSTGVISQLDAALSDWHWPFLDQTSAIVMHGSSGGALWQEYDDTVVGVVVGLLEPGVAFFVPTRAVSFFAEQHHVFFAVRGTNCPSDSVLDKLIDSAKVVPSAKEPAGPPAPDSKATHKQRSRK